ncbi:263_t:CDS:2 [Diversispora eburnea]|uniref:263_t:CDS:1 n=1 Tax=Diversispora eburnea TaxID=1213867 RepID=A0A9N9B7F4_9GLOM|nr:263_t:CDS:2 [Diversispora eburnea]
MSRAEIIAFSTSVIIAIACTVAIGYQTYIIPNKLRITCLLCVPLHISSLLLAFTRSFFGSPELKWYTNSYLLITSIYSSASILCIMDIGKSKFYPQNYYNTTLYKLAIIFLSAANIICVISIVLIMLERIVALISIPFYLTTNLLGGPGSYYWQITAYIDVMLRYSVIMVVGMTPSKNLLLFIKRKSFRMTTLDISIGERDVISCEIDGVDSGIWNMNDLEN